MLFLSRFSLYSVATPTTLSTAVFTLSATSETFPFIHSDGFGIGNFGNPSSGIFALIPSNPILTPANDGILISGSFILNLGSLLLTDSHIAGALPFFLPSLVLGNLSLALHRDKVVEIFVVFASRTDGLFADLIRFAILRVLRTLFLALETLDLTAFLARDIFVVTFDRILAFVAFLVVFRVVLRTALFATLRLTVFRARVTFLFTVFRARFTLDRMRLLLLLAILFPLA